MKLANGFDLNNRSSRLKVTAAGFDQLDSLSVAVIVLRFLVYLVAAAIVHDYDEKLVIAAAFMEVAAMGITLVVTFKRDILIGCAIRLIEDVILAGAGLGAIYVNGIIATYLRDVQKRESVIVILVVFNILLVVVEAARSILSLDVLLAASTSKHRSSPTKEFATRVRRSVQMISTAICACLLAGTAVFAGSIVSALDSVSVDMPIYQCVKSEFINYDYPTTVRKQGNGCVLLDKSGAEVTLAETPLYFGQGSKTEKILLPRTYAIIQPAISSTKRIDNLSLVTLESGVYTVSSESGEREASDFFLYDGRDTYIFFEDTTVTIGDKTINVAPFSYLTAISNGSLSYFDPRSRESSTYSLIGREAIALMRDGTRIDVGTNILIKTDGSEQMLFMNPSNLSDYLS